MSQGSWAKLAYAILLHIGTATLCYAAPPGRAWTQPEGVAVPTWDLVGSPFLRPDSTGHPKMQVYVERAGGATSAPVGLIWTGSSWSQALSVNYGITRLSPVSQPPGSDVALSVGTSMIPSDPTGSKRFLILADLRAGSVDTLGIVSQIASQRAGVITDQYVWVLVNNSGSLELFSRPRTGGIWKHMYIPAAGPSNVTAASTTDTTAILAWDCSTGLCWATATPDTFEVRGSITPDAGGPGAWTATDGTTWLGWGSLQSASMLSSLDGTQWSAPQSLACNYQQPDPSYVLGIALGGFSGHNPVLATISVLGSQLVTCVSLPSPSGYYLGDQLPGGYLGPTVTADKNDDAWVAWYSLPAFTTFWAHTYCTAEVLSVAVTPTSPERTLSWVISESAPGSWWEVERAVSSGAFDQVARVKADTSPNLSWTDVTDPPDALLRYRVRRGSVDSRYSVVSDEVTWNDPTPVQLSLASVVVEAGSVALAWRAPGAGNLEASVQRRTESGDWQVIGAALPEGIDALLYVDSTVSPGHRYAYRLAWIEDQTALFTSAAWVDVPQGPSLALEGFVPNPSVRGTSIAFTLPSFGKAVLEVVDVAGRRVFRRDVGSMGAGRHLVKLDGSERYRPGVYLISLTQGGSTIRARGVITR
jgi:hypothetical protein